MAHESKTGVSHGISTVFHRFSMNARNASTDMWQHCETKALDLVEIICHLVASTV